MLIKYVERVGGLALIERVLTGCVRGRVSIISDSDKGGHPRLTNDSARVCRRGRVYIISDSDKGGHLGLTNDLIELRVKSDHRKSVLS